MNLCLSCRASTLSNAVSSLASTGMSFTKVDEREKQAALEEEQARLKALKVALVFQHLQLTCIDQTALQCLCCLCVCIKLPRSLRNRGSKNSPRGPPSLPLIRRQSPPPGALSAQHQPSTSSLHPAALMGTASIYSISLI